MKGPRQRIIEVFLGFGVGRVGSSVVEQHGTLQKVGWLFGVSVIDEGRDKEGSSRGVLEMKVSRQNIFVGVKHLCL